MIGTGSWRGILVTERLSALPQPLLQDTRKRRLGSPPAEQTMRSVPWLAVARSLIVKVHNPSQPMGEGVPSLVPFPMNLAVKVRKAAAWAAAQAPELAAALDPATLGRLGQLHSP